MRKLTRLQSVFFHTAAVVETACILLFGYRVTGFKDPVAVAVFLIATAAVVWATRKWVQSSITDEVILGLIRKK